MKQTILKTFPTLLTDGAFFKEFSLFNREDVSLTPLQAGQAYALAHSGNKAITSMTENFCGDDGTVTSASCVTLGTILENMFGTDWNRELDALLAEYNPIENYNMVEEGSDTKSGSDTLTDDYAMKRNTKTSGAHTDTFNVGQDRITDSFGATQTTYGGHTDTSTHSVSAYDSSGWSNAEKDVTEVAQHIDSEAARSDTHTTDARVDSTVYGSKQDTTVEDAYKDTHETEYDNTVEHELTRSGNIGTTTNQMMIRSEIELRSTNFFYDILFRDVDKLLALGCY